MKIRRFNLKKDSEFILKRLQEMYYPFGEHKISKEEKKEFKHRLVSTSKSKNYPKLIAEINGQVVGFIFLEIQKIESGKKSMNIDQLFVDKKHRRKSIGTELIKESKKLAKKLKCKFIEMTCRVDNKYAVKLYRKLKFKSEPSAIHFSCNIK